ncbi:PDZ domain-containing protein [Candidatus Fermentibacterales bacterium]|nr:PDZ domain-containing protein [Candidatus Fermentibacterales bacterium]
MKTSPGSIELSVTLALALTGAVAASSPLDRLALAPAGEERESRTLECIESYADLEDFLEAVSAWRPAANPSLEPMVLYEDSIEYIDGITRHFYFVLPGTGSDGPRPLLVYLHGGVSTEELASYSADEVLGDHILIPRVLEEGMLVALPCAQLGAVWWDQAGEQGIVEIVRYMKAHFDVDDSKVFVGGFSDGASGSFGLAMLRPTPFAGFIALSGHMGVASLDGGRATYARSLAGRMVYAANTDLDRLYPAEQMLPTMALAESAGARIVYRAPEGWGHDWGYVPGLEGEILDFMLQVGREDYPSVVDWQTGEPGGRDWLRVDSIIPWPLLGEDFDHNMVMASDRLTFGFFPDWESDSDGVGVAGVVEEGDYPSVRMGMQSGDVITGFRGRAIRTMEDLYAAMEGMSPGDAFAMTLERDGRELEVSDHFNPPSYYWLFERTGPSVYVKATINDNVVNIETNRLCVLTLHLSQEMLELDQPVEIVCNGIGIFHGLIGQDLETAVRCFSETLDRQRVYVASMRLDLEELLLALLASSTDA